MQVNRILVVLGVLFLGLLLFVQHAVHVSPHEPRTVRSRSPDHSTGRRYAVEEPTHDEPNGMNKRSASTPVATHVHVDPHIRKAVFWASTLSKGLRDINNSTLPAVLMEFYTQEVEVVVFQLLRLGESVATLRAHGFTSDEILEATFYTINKVVELRVAGVETAGENVPTCVKVARSLFHDVDTALAMMALRSTRRPWDWRAAGCSIKSAVESDPTWLPAFLDARKDPADTPVQASKRLHESVRLLVGGGVTIHQIRSVGVDLKLLVDSFVEKPRGPAKCVPPLVALFAGCTVDELQRAGANPWFIRCFQEAQQG